MATPTVNSIASLSRKLARTDSISLPDADVIDYANLCLHDIHKELIIAGLEPSQIVEQTLSLISGTGSYNTASNAWILKSMEVNWQDPTNQNLWVPVNRVDIANLPPLVTVDWMRLNQPSNSPKVDWRGNTFELFPTPTATNPVNPTNALKYFFWQTPTEYVNITDSLAYPETLDYRMMAHYVASLYLATFTEEEKESISNEKLYLKRLNDLKKIFQTAGQRPILPESYGLTGYEF